jgi:hypothetical protein
MTTLRAALAQPSPIEEEATDERKARARAKKVANLKEAVRVEAPIASTDDLRARFREGQIERCAARLLNGESAEALLNEYDTTVLLDARLRAGLATCGRITREKCGNRADLIRARLLAPAQIHDAISIPPPR